MAQSISLRDLLPCEKTSARISRGLCQFAPKGNLQGVLPSALLSILLSIHVLVSFWIEDDYAIAHIGHPGMDLSDGCHGFVKLHELTFFQHLVHVEVLRISNTTIFITEYRDMF